MDRQNEFINLIDLGILTVQNFLNQTEFLLYANRYRRMLENLADLKNATLKGILATNFVYLGVTQMLDHNDPKQLENAILAINTFYCDNYRILD